ncbi:DUF523 domain-containing protein [Dongshaea marina]|uniref:DUF523 domain-containing protein n=1 Tax=Dongshaea marina TaxID=2047966 RepID=UPI000D3EC60A|nr:DUF523 domain-containing protein [Dongshaea marina]
MEKILISACLMGDKVRYDGGDKQLSHPLIKQLRQQQRLIPCCPEVAAGLPIPRPPCEISGVGGGSGVLDQQDRIITREHDDYTQAFIQGALMALALCQQYGIRFAILTENSPSCGSGTIYDGSFCGNKVPGSGVTTALLIKHGVRVFNQYQLDQLQQLLSAKDSTTHQG